MGLLEPDEDEPGIWFQELEEVPPDTAPLCHRCQYVAEFKDADDEYWCCQCAGDHDRELSYEDPDLP